MQPFGSNIWTGNGDGLRMYGVLPFATRMTVVWLEAGGMWAHSPVAPTPDRCRAMDELGPIEHLVAPNKIHSLGVSPWRTLYPSAQVWASPQFSGRHPNITVDTRRRGTVE